MYTDRNFKSKKDLKAAVAAYIEAKKNPDPEISAKARPVTYFQPGGMFPAPVNGRFCVEGPHYPQPHKWYATCIAENNVIVKVS
jgi:hypothetical protein